MSYTELYFKKQTILICGLLGIIVVGGTLLAIAYASKRLTEHITRQGESENELCNNCHLLDKLSKEVQKAKDKKLYFTVHGTEYEIAEKQEGENDNIIK